MMSKRPTHIAEDGSAHMIDVSGKPETKRRAIAQGQITMSANAMDALISGQSAKGSILNTARIAGIMAAKQTSQTIPLCHAIPIAKVSLDFELGNNSVQARAEIVTNAATGVEMEALHAVSVALLTIYDMLKAVDRSMSIADIRLHHKSGGQSGEWSTTR